MAEVFKLIKKQTGLTIFYSNRLLNDQEFITAKFQNAEIKDVLNYILKNKSLSYVLSDQLIVIEKVKPTTSQKEPVQVSQPKKIQGMVTDSKGLPLPGVSVRVKDTNTGMQTDLNGKFSLNVNDADHAIIVFSFIGFKKQEIELKKYKPANNGNYVIDIVMIDNNDNNLEDVAIVAYGTQKKTSLISSITTVSPKDLKGPSSNLTTMLAGVIPGMISYQRSGEPGADNAQFFIRGVGTFGAGKVDPLILIDGIESSGYDLSRLQPDDIAGFSVLKDATASALYGARGANGVILVVTKKGDVGKTKFTVRLENSLSANTRKLRWQIILLI
ncbi:TonB-dependent receptor plug domain-containing protein [Pedobacter sp. NJ-S-72]